MKKSLTKQALAALAGRLAARLANHAYCDFHPEAKSDPECPSCDDRAAYKAWLAAGGNDFRLFAADRHLADN
ncbi:hypothetical protein ACQP2T_63940 (plasmid) [Nonomuraea sp. CA-143628]|uniref:hypothetical protein n=1 Tax=Nonomuraea sp. CA-143628 TaxID=3239997 RepID=UPI003D90E93E